MRANNGYRDGESLSQKDAYQILGQNEEQCLKFANEQDSVSISPQLASNGYFPGSVVDQSYGLERCYMQLLGQP